MNVCSFYMHTGMETQRSVGVYMGSPKGLMEKFTHELIQKRGKGVCKGCKAGKEF
jgi:hypothetical protein